MAGDEIPQDREMENRPRIPQNEGGNIPAQQRVEGTTTQKTAAAIIALLILFLVVCWVLRLATLTIGQNYVDPSGIGVLETTANSSSPELLWPWDIFLWFAIKGEFVGKALASLLAILSLGSQFLATLHRKLWSVLLICGSCLVGIVCSIVVLIWIDVVELRSFVDGGTDKGVQTSIYAFVGGLIAWFGAFMATQLGISLKRPAGILKKFVGNG